MKKDLVLYVDAAANRSEKVVNSYGKKAKWSKGFKIAVVSDDKAIRETFVNTKAANSLAAEAFAVLKAVEVAVKSGASSARICSDVIGALDMPASNQGDRYLWLARKMISESGLAVEIAVVDGAQNPADALSREVTTVEADKPASGTLDELLAAMAAFGQDKSAIRRLEKKHGLAALWEKWREVEALQIKRNLKPKAVIEALNK